MSDHTKIAWSDATWNPVTGCSKITPGCKFCYAEREWRRLSANPKAPVYFGRAFTDVRGHEDRLDPPLRWRRPRKIFVNSMSDLFHESVPDAFIDRVFAVMALSPQHTFQVLTKRPERMRDYLDARCDNREHAIGKQMIELSAGRDPGLPELPLPNVCLGVSAENQDTADERILLLIQTPAAVRWVSLEPLIGPVDLEEVPVGMFGPLRPHGGVSAENPRLDWVVVGGESGPHARPFDLAWARQIIEQCKTAGVPCFMKQLGAHPGYRGQPPLDGWHDLYSNGEILRGRPNSDPAAWPADLRVREWPLCCNEDKI